MKRWLKKALHYERVAGVHMFKLGNSWYAVYCHNGIPRVDVAKAKPLLPLSRLKKTGSGIV